MDSSLAPVMLGNERQRGSNRWEWRIYMDLGKAAMLDLFSRSWDRTSGASLAEDLLIIRRGWPEHPILAPCLIQKLGTRRRQKSAPRSLEARPDAAALASAPGEQG